MMKKLIIAIIGILIVSIGFAGVLQYYGKIIGNVNVQPPVFYVSTDCLGSVCKLYINSLPGDYSGTVEKNSVYFDSQPLNVESWYRGEWKIVLKLKGTTENQRVDYYLRFANSDYKSICNGYISISTQEEEVTISCKSNSIELTSQHYLELFLASKSNFVVYADGSTKIEVTST